MSNFNHTLSIDNKSKLLASEIGEVVSFSEKDIKLKLKDGNFVFIEGGNLKILCFDNSTGNFNMVGNILSVKYKDKSVSIAKKVFK